jgi:beta-mannosidase
MAPPYSSTPLASGWTFKQGGLESNSAYLPAHDLPTEVHRDLVKNSIIADPFLDLNELSVRWVADETWTYRTTFPCPSGHQVAGSKTFLTFQGLDTFASVFLNGKAILESENMFIEHRVYASDKLESGGAENVLEIEFQSARKRGLGLVKEHPEHRFIVHQTEISRGPVRKAQYHWGWDWGPILLTCGPWKPITIETYINRVEDYWVEYELSDDLNNVKGKLYAKVEGDDFQEVRFQLHKVGHGRDSSGFKAQKNNDGVFEASFDLSSLEGTVDLWWPRNYGAQTLYSFTATIIDNEGKSVHEQSKTIGFRKVELVQKPDSIGTSFYFRVNNTDIFCGGSCWIPTDSLLSSISDARYRDWVKLAAEGNQTMIRVWGGGIYEPSAFYSACDEFGILVWQDFMFACANYPAYPSYLQSVETEARQNVRRVRNHASVVVWAGNNEDYQIVERYGLEYKFTEDKDPDSWLKTDFPARYIYEHLLPKIVKEETKGVPYHPSSPWGNGTSTTLKVDPTVGDIHQWNVWHGEMKPYQKLPEMGGRFVSEFGMEAYPHLETMEKCITKEEDRRPGCMTVDFRNKAIGHERRLISYVSENFQVKYDLENFTHLSQVMQADAMSWAYKSWRRKWGTKDDRQSGGVLVWQLNDCWPTISWAVVDYYLVPKPAYYAMKRAMEPIVVGVTRKTNDWTMRPADELWKRDTSHVDMRSIWEDVEFDVWVASSRAETLKGAVVVKFISIRSGKEVLDKLEEDVLIGPNGTTDIIQNRKVSLPKPQGPDTAYDTSKADPFVMYASLIIEGKEVATDISWPDPIKYLSFPDRGVNVEYSDDQSTMTVSASRPVKGFVFSETQDTKLSDNGFDLIPGESKVVKVIGGSPKELKWKYVQQ